MNTTPLIHRLNRLQGQIEAIRTRLESDQHNCVETLRLLKASQQALKKFGEAYLIEHLHDCMEQPTSPKDMQSTLEEVIHTTFSL